MFMYWALLQVVIPAGLLCSIVLRPYGMSLVYLLLFLITPALSTPKACCGLGSKYLIIIMFLSSILLTVHVAWHACLASFSPYGSILEFNPLFPLIAKNLGLIRYDNIDAQTAVKYLAPELVMLTVSLFVYISVRNFLPSSDDTKNEESKYQRYPILVDTGKFVALSLILASGIMRPSITSGIYFLVFLGLSTAWALGKPLERGFAIIQRILMCLMAVHVSVLMAYQCTELVQLYPPEKDLARYFGLTKLVTLSDNNFEYNSRWSTIASPVVILVTYYFLGLESTELLKPKVAFVHISSKAPQEGESETSPLMRSMRKTKRMSMRSGFGKPQQNSIGSVIISDEESMMDIGKPTVADEVSAAFLDLVKVLIRSSYIATIITMMTWSIMYHSWLSFVFLMWGNLIWLSHDQRSFMLKTSPLPVFYAICLLLADYIYGMELTEEELPSKIDFVNLSQIGIGRSDVEPCIPLSIKSLFTWMFWVTLRQRCQEVRDKRYASKLADISAPLQLTMSTAASVMDLEQEGRSRVLASIGKWLRAMCARYWIYVVVIMLFVIGITGDRMTIFRIVYMFLFLSFILMFQLNWYWWRRLMYSFWITVIIYSMINLVLIYIYQFDNFSKTIEDYLYINERLQRDLGLEPYHRADLFVKLLVPTLFLIMTIMQVHYFHKDFMRLSDPKVRSVSVNDIKVGSSRPSQGASTIQNDISPLENDRPASSTSDKSTQKDMSSSFNMDREDRKSRKLSRARSQHAMTEHSLKFMDVALNTFMTMRELSSKWIDKIFIFLDLHLIKILLLSCMLLCVLNVCAMHVPLMLIISPAYLLSRSKQRKLIHLISILITVYFMAMMVYQIPYIKHTVFDVTCRSNALAKDVTLNDAEWIGFTKSNKDIPLASLLKGYIAMITMFIIFSLVTYRQETIRSLHDAPSHGDDVMFPEVKRADADKDLVNCIKFLFNYGFYKFGVEITLICLVGVIGSRMDFYSVIYAIWLIVLTSVKRTKKQQLWTTFTVFITLLIPIQYFMAVGFMPELCIIDLPWSGDSDQMKHIRNWFFLPCQLSPPHSSKLICDYILLVLASRQLRVFRTEKRHGWNYPGGSNKENIGKDWETPDFVNPVPDFLGQVGSWLDLLKRMIFLGMLWVTLAIMFLAGTNRVNLFSMGYLVGSFIVLWQGTDFYLRPKETILLWWSWLIRYNVAVVMVKTLLQLPGCVFKSFMHEQACWLVQLLGIGCVDKFAGGSIKSFIRMSFYESSTCSLAQKDIGLAWDGVCFAFLILQRRLFDSYYFFRVIDESKASTVLASRGAELIEELRQKQMQAQDTQEVNILEKIKIKMERIKANQKKIQGVLKDPKYHERDDEDFEDDTQRGATEQVLVGDCNEEADRGFHTPQSPTSPRGFHTPVSESDESPPPSAPPSPPVARPRTILPPLHPPAAPTSSHGGPPSPSSALMTVSLDGYLEPRRISFESPPSSELIPRAQSPEESYPVFSPPPIRRRHTLASPSVLQRTSIISVSSRAEPLSHHTCESPTYKPPASHQSAIRSGDYYMFEEFDDWDGGLIKTDEVDAAEEDQEIPKEMGLGKLLTTVINTDVKRAVQLQRKASSVGGSGVQSFSETCRDSKRSSRPESRSQSRAASARRESEESNYEEMAEEADKETTLDRLKGYLELTWALISSFLTTITRYLMKYSRDYRYVSRTLSLEKRKLKETEGFGIGTREGVQMIWQPLPETLVNQHGIKSSDEEDESVNQVDNLTVPVEMGRKLSDISVPEIRILAPSMERGLDASPVPGRSAAPSNLTCEDDDDTSEHESMFSLQSSESKVLSTLEEQDDSFRHGRSPIVRLLKALWYAIVAHTDIVCYIMVFINQIQSATILSIPLPLMVFLWGTLTIPRPTKTFWVTLIAYTEVIVLIKSMFQFEILPWNQKVIPENMPFTAPRIIGIERKNDYALYDLLLLLIIFLHRFMLKSLGLWKESASDVEVPDDMEYCLTPEDAQLVIKGQGDEVGRKYIQQTEDTSPAVPDTKITTVNEIQSVETIDKASNTENAGPSRLASEKEDNAIDNDLDVPMIAVTTTIHSTQDHYPGVIKLSLKRYLSPVRHFFRRMMEPGARVTADVYAYMFLCDFANFMVVIFGFAAFGTHQGDGGVQAYLEENKVPLPFLVMLILQFALIVIDRALYLRKYILGKILFQYALVIGVHIWMFFVLPAITERKFNALLPPPIWYMLKSLYLLLSAYQIRCGYPRRIIGNFLCKSYRFINMVLFRCFMAVPFVFELRTLMDWIWTDTSMTLVEWLKMEDIFACIFLLKCGRCMESDFPSKRGTAKSKTIKYMLGGSVLAFVIAIIWFPLVFFAFGNTVGEPNAPTDVTVKIRIGPFLPVYQMTAQSHNIELYTEAEYSQLSNLYARDRNAQTFLSNYMFNDVAVVTINPNSTMKWVISPPELDRLEREVVSNSTLMVTFSFIITHPSNSVDNPPTIEDSREVPMVAQLGDIRNPERDKLYNMLAGTETEPQWLDVKAIFPKFLKVFNKGTAKPAYQLMPPNSHDDSRPMYRDIQLRIERDRGSLYWRVRETCGLQDPLLSIPLNKCDMLVMYTFNDKLFPATLNFISGGGIIGLYTTFVFLASRVLRGSFTGIYSQIMFDDLPNVDRVLQLCLDIYLVREALELTLEEDLFAKLVFLYRSPETMIKWSRPKDEEQQRSLPSTSQ